MKSRKQFYDLERAMKGAANHRRIEMLFLLKKKPALSTADIVDELEVSYQAGAKHVQRLVRSGLVSAYRRSNEMLHELSPLGQKITKLLMDI